MALMRNAVAFSRNMVLIVEDEDAWAQVYRRTVHGFGEELSVQAAKTYVAAVKLIESMTFAVAFIDIGLDISDDRNVDGIRVMEKIRENSEDTCIILVTGRSGQDVIQITSDAIEKYNAYGTVGKGSVTPANLRRLLEGALLRYRDSLTRRAIEEH